MIALRAPSRSCQGAWREEMRVLNRRQARQLCGSIGSLAESRRVREKSNPRSNGRVERVCETCKSLENRKPLAIRLFTNSARSAESPQQPQPNGPLATQLKARLAALTPKAHENIYTLPNILTFTRLLAAPAVGYLILHDQQLWAVSLFAYAGITDLIDGWIARRWKLQTVIGSVIDPMADKALMTVVVVCLAIKGGLPLWLATLILGRDVSLGIAAFYYRYASLPYPKTFLRYWDFSLPSAEVHPTTVSKWNTFLQLALIGSTLTLPVLTPGVLAPLGLEMGQLESALKGAQYVVAGTTLWSGWSYVWNKKVVKILGDDEALKKKQGFRGRAILGSSLAVFTALAVASALRDERKEEAEIEGVQ